jgi:hypothetical protein
VRKPVGNPRREWVVDIRLDLREVGFEDER